MCRRIRDHTPDRDPEPFGVLVRDPGDGLQAVRNVVLQVGHVIVDSDLRIVEQRRQRRTGEQVVELLLRNRPSEASYARSCVSQSCRYQEVRQPRRTVGVDLARAPASGSTQESWIDSLVRFQLHQETGVPALVRR